jgi:hypothetical protein
MPRDFFHRRSQDNFVWDVKVLIRRQRNSGVDCSIRCVTTPAGRLQPMMEAARSSKLWHSEMGRSLHWPERANRAPIDNSHRQLG